MKTKLLIYYGLFCFLINTEVQGGWVLQTAPSQTVNLNSTRFTDTCTGWAVGTNGAIYKTANGGTAWITQTSGTTTTLYSAYFLDTNMGWVGGSGPLKTVNGGAIWSFYSLSWAVAGTSPSLNSVFFTSKDTGYSAGMYTEGSNTHIYECGEILKTMDGGVNWFRSESFCVGGYPSYTSLTSVYFININIGYAVGGNLYGTSAGPSGIILKTINGGSSWAAESSTTTMTLNSVYFTDANIGYVVGAGGVILKTVNGGTSWNAQTSGTTKDLYSVHFTSSTTGWIAGQGGTILNTTNAGASWTTEVTGTTKSLHSIHFVNATYGWAVGDSGTILKHTLAPTTIPPYRRALFFSSPEGLSNLTDVRGRMIWKKQNTFPVRSFTANREAISRLPQK